MKTSGVSCETKFGLLVFLGHPTHHAWHPHPLHAHQAGQLLAHVASHPAQHVERVASILEGWECFVIIMIEDRT